MSYFIIYHQLFMGTPSRRQGSVGWRVSEECDMINVPKEVEEKLSRSWNKIIMATYETCFYWKRLARLDLYICIK